MPTPHDWATTVRTVTLAEVAERRCIPLMLPIGGREGDALWLDGGDEPLTEDAVAAILATAAEQGWPEDAMLSIDRDHLDGSLHAAREVRAAFPRHTSPWFRGYGLAVTVPGGEPRPAVYLSGEDALRVGLTASERAELDQERWDAAEAALTEEQRIVRDLTRAEIHRRKLHESEQERATALRELVLRALDAGISAVDVAHYAKLSRARVYQIRDGRR